MSRDRVSDVEVYGAVCESLKDDLHTFLPARVVLYDRARNRATVQLLIRYRVGDQYVTEPTLDDRPVGWLGGGGGGITGDLSPGDSVAVQFAEASLNEWIQTGGLSNPTFLHRLSASDGLVIPYTFAVGGSPLPGVKGAWQLGRSDGSAYVRVTTQGAAVATVEAPLVKLGAVASLGVNREGDALTPSTSFSAWVVAVSTATGAVPPLSLGVTGPGSLKVKAE